MAKETAHQMGTPLTSIMGWLALLKEQVPPEDEVVETVRAMYENCRKPAALLAHDDVIQLHRASGEFVERGTGRLSRSVTRAVQAERRA